MTPFYFYDTDLTDKMELDIAGEAYFTLMKTCFRNCDRVAFRLTTSCDLPEAALVPLPETAREAYRSHYSEQSIVQQACCFYLTSEVQTYLMKRADSLFAWNGYADNNPEDPVFLRPDDTVFLSTLIHEGACILMPREAENVQPILSSALWTEKKRRRY